MWSCDVYVRHAGLDQNHVNEGVQNTETHMGMRSLCIVYTRHEREVSKNPAAYTSARWRARGGC